VPVGAACKAPPQPLPTERHVAAKPAAHERKEHKKDHHVEHNKLHSSSVEEHAIRFDHHGNTREEYKDSHEHHDNHVDESPRKKKKKAARRMRESDEADHRANINNMLNDEVVKKQLQIRDIADEDTDEDEEDDGIPLITIPMVDILKQYQRMAQGFQSSTEEYSDELPPQKKVDHFEDPHLRDALHEISAERKKVKQDKKDGKKVKPAARRVFDDVSRSDEEL
jgi:hypothetical protein